MWGRARDALPGQKYRELRVEEGRMNSEGSVTLFVAVWLLRGECFTEQRHYCVLLR